MGFRSVFITEDSSLDIPEWFLSKWHDWFHFHIDKNGRSGFPISSQIEQKMYNFEDFHLDLQKVVIENEKESPATTKELILVWFHECGGITRVEIHINRILYSEPSGWEKVENSTHSYCYGCSDHPDIVYERTHCTCGGQTIQGDICVKCQKISPLASPDLNQRP